MVNFPGRNARRRRVLNEEVLSASNARSALRAVSDEQPDYQPNRYSDAAGVENHPQITDYVPRRYRTIALLVVAGIACTAAFAALHYVAPRLAAALGVANLPPFDLAAAGSLASWVAAIVLLLAAATCMLVYSIRRHRIDDYRGRYRVWFAAAVACLVLSANSVAGLHHVLAHTFSYVTGWSALRAGAIWWLAVAGLPLAWIALRTLRDVLECRLAAALWIAAIGCYLSAAACYFGLAPAAGARLDSMLDVVLTLTGHWLLLAAVVSYARYVVLDAQGLIPVRAAEGRSQDKSNRLRKANPPALPAAVRSKQSVPAKTDESVDREAWIDGSAPESKRYDDDSDDEFSGGSSKLSKADRKRLRKLKAQNRAA